MNLGPWKLWADERPPEPGYYWLAGYFTHDEYGDPRPLDCIEPEEPIIWEIGEDDISGRYNIVNVHGYEAKNLIWSGPLLMPELPK